MKTEREYPRYPVNLEVSCSTRDAFLLNTVSNLSRGGMFIKSTQPLPLSAEVELTMTLPGANVRITARGRVVWNYDIPKGTSHVVQGMGIRFLDMTTADRRRLTDYLGSLPPAPLSARALG